MNLSFVERCFGVNSQESPCPERTYVMMCPFLLFWITLPFQFVTLKTRTERTRNFTRSVFLRILLFLILAGNEAFELVSHSLPFELSHWKAYGPYLFGVFSLISMMISSIVSVSRGHRSNGYVYTTLLLLFIVDLTVGILDLLDKSVQDIEKTSLIRLIILMVINILNCTNDTKKDDMKDDLSPEDYSTFFGGVVFSWMDKMIRTGSKKTLTMDDVYPLSPHNKSVHLMEQWNTMWNELEDEHEERRISQSEGSSDIPPPSIGTALTRMYRTHVAFAIGLRYISNFLQYMNPILLTYLLNFVSDPKAPLSYGIAIVITMFLIAETCSVLNNTYMNEMTIVSSRVQSILTNAVFQKTLRLSATSRNKRTVGEIINFMSVDVENVADLFFQLGDAFSCPLQVLLAMVFLYVTIGWLAIPGSLFVLVFIPLNYFSSIFIEEYQSKQMEVKDERTKISTEILNGIKLIKLYAWEEAFEKRINALRRKEVGHMVTMNLFSSGVDAANGSAPLVIAVITFSCYIFFSEEKVLTPQVAFVCIAIFNQMCIPMRVVAEFVIFVVQAMVSQKRLNEFFNEHEMNEQHVQESQQGFSVQIDDGSFNWTGPENPSDVKNITMNLRTGDFVTIVGTVGSGKSSVLSSIIGEMHTLSGSISYTGRIAYVPQQAWILNTTLRNNIIFGKEFNPRLYSKVISASELETDFAEMEFGDQTEIGENGVTLSGGQKARVGIARALYQEADIYLLDDCLSAVDAHVGAAVFQKAFSNDGFLRNKTRILVTHGLQYTISSDKIFVMNEGTIVEEGDYQDLVDQQGVFSELVKKKDEQSSEESSEEEEIAKVQAKRRSHRISTDRSLSENDALLDDSGERGRLIRQESVETGNVGFNVVRVYIKAATYKWSTIFILMHFSHVCLTVLRGIWMSEWTNEHDSKDKEDPRERLAVYTGIGFIEVLAVLFTHFARIKCGQNASFRLHAPLLHSILRSPMKFFDTTPVGRILNRLSKDLEDIDVHLPNVVSLFFECSFNILLILSLITFSTPAFIIAVIPVAGISIYIYYIFLPTTRQIRREESKHRSPILSRFGECIQGSSSIRAYKKVDETVRNFFVLNDEHNRCLYYLFSANRWLAIRLELIGCVVILLAGLFAVMSTRYSKISPGLVGMSVSYAFTFAEELFYAICLLANIEMNGVAVERVEAYSHLEEEAEWRSPSPPPKDWPQKGEIEWKNFSTRYRPELPLIINNISGSTNSAEKVGVVGRTGSGKSSLTLALYRLIEAAEGTIFIDGVDISKIGLHELRSKLTIIPQDPVLFSGSLRFNLDPFEEYTDDELWTALEACQLREYASSQTGKLDFEISEGGQNMSVGQRQLVCLGRALLRKGRILILDEATAACDVQTDSFVQQVIREKFDDSTVLAIAHRLNTIENYDRILVLDSGNIAEFDAPQTLLSNSESKYAKMVEKAKSHQH